MRGARGSATRPSIRGIGVVLLETSAIA